MSTTNVTDKKKRVDEWMEVFNDSSYRATALVSGVAAEYVPFSKKLATTVDSHHPMGTSQEAQRESGVGRSSLQIVQPPAPKLVAPTIGFINAPSLPDHAVLLEATGDMLMMSKKDIEPECGDNACSCLGGIKGAKQPCNGNGLQEEDEMRNRLPMLDV